MRGSLGDRIKSYEAVSNHVLTPNSCVFIRVDGKSFHTFTKGCEKPFDRLLMEAMIYAGQKTAQHIQGFKLAYIQSDECTFMLSDYDTHETQGWFGYELNKLVSLSASIFTAYFNEYYNGSKNLAFFDSRAFVVPVDDAPNVFVWRQQDWKRNSIQMLAQANFSHNELQGRNLGELLDMLYDKGISWDLQSDIAKYGTFILKDAINEPLWQELNFYQIEEILKTI